MTIGLTDLDEYEEWTPPKCSDCGVPLVSQDTWRRADEAERQEWRDDGFAPGKAGQCNMHYARALRRRRLVEQEPRPRDPRRDPTQPIQLASLRRREQRQARRQT